MDEIEQAQAAMAFYDKMGNGLMEVHKLVYEALGKLALLGDEYDAAVTEDMSSDMIFFLGGLSMLTDSLGNVSNQMIGMGQTCVQGYDLISQAVAMNAAMASEEAAVARAKQS